MCASLRFDETPSTHLDKYTFIKRIKLDSVKLYTKMYINPGTEAKNIVS